MGGSDGVMECWSFGLGGAARGRAFFLTFKGTRQVEALTIYKDNHGRKPGTAR